MFCKICFDANSSAFECHNLKDRAGNVICPRLLNTKCQNCNVFGHTKKYCKNNFLSNYDNRTSFNIKNSVTFSSSVKQLAGKEFKNINTNSFSLLCDEIDDNYKEDYDSDDIIWGLGLRSNIGRAWSDIVDDYE